MLLNLGVHSINYFDRISSISDQYDAYLIDVWGVLHDNARPYPGAINCLAQLKKKNKSIILVSNAARRSSMLAKEFTPFNITEGLYDHIVSSGELVWNAFFNGKDTQLQNLGSRYYLLGAEKYGLANGLNLIQVKDLEQADFLFAIGVIGNPSNTEAKESVLQDAVNQGLTMVCANPDLKVVRDGIIGIAAGALAARYKELGGQVFYYGKPHPGIYHRCFELLKGLDKSRIAAVGDSLHTDIAGANAAGIASIMIGSGIHKAALEGLPHNQNDFLELCQQEKQIPAFVVKAFTW